MPCAAAAPAAAPAAAAEFTNCTVPLVWWVTYFSVFGDLYIGGALALDMMQQQGAFDRWACARGCVCGGG